jgi:TPR repeat protein
MKRSILIATLFLMTSMLICADVLAQTKTPTLYQRLQPRSQGAWEHSPGRWAGDSKSEDVRRDLSAAKSGDASAQFKMGLRYDLGVGVPQNYNESVNWLRKAAEQGLAEAQYNLGSMYAGGLGVPQDFTEAVQWFRKAAEQGEPSAQKNLGAMYGTGQGVSQSHAEAYVWSSIAVMSGSESAIDNRDYAASKLSPEEMTAAQKRATRLYGEIRQ